MEKLKKLDPNKSTIAELLAFLRDAESMITPECPEFDRISDAQADFLSGYALGFVAELVENAVQMSKFLSGK